MTTPGTLRRVSFTVAGLPAPQGSKAPGRNKHTGKLFVREMSGEKLTNWRQDVRAEAFRVMLGNGVGTERLPLAGPLGVTLAFTLPEPKNRSAGWREWSSWWLRWPWRRPDKDKLERATMDALTGPVFADDAQVVVSASGKFYAGGSYSIWGLKAPSFTGVAIEVWQIGEDYD